MAETDEAGGGSEDRATLSSRLRCLNLIRKTTLRMSSEGVVSQGVRQLDLCLFKDLSSNMAAEDRRGVSNDSGEAILVTKEKR